MDHFQALAAFEDVDAQDEGENLRKQTVAQVMTYSFPEYMAANGNTIGNRTSILNNSMEWPEDIPAAVCIMLGVYGALPVCWVRVRWQWLYLLYIPLSSGPLPFIWAGM